MRGLHVAAMKSSRLAGLSLSSQYNLDRNLLTAQSEAFDPRVSTTPGNTGNLLEFEIPSGNTGNLLDFC